jgi:uncharacterized DUF497 family protein
LANIRKHGLDLIDAWEVFESPLLARLDKRIAYGEERWTGIGMMKNRALVVMVVFTERGSETIRVISLRKATTYERKQYQKAIQGGLETD